MTKEGWPALTFGGPLWAVLLELVLARWPIVVGGAPIGPKEAFRSEVSGSIVGFFSPVISRAAKIVWAAAVGSTARQGTSTHTHCTRAPPSLAQIHNLAHHIPACAGRNRAMEAAAKRLGEVRREAELFIANRAQKEQEHGARRAGKIMERVASSKEQRTRNTIEEARSWSKMVLREAEIIQEMRNIALAKHATTASMALLIGMRAGMWCAKLRI